MKILFVHNFYQNFGGEDASALAEKALLESHGEDLIPYMRDNKDLREAGFLQKLDVALEAVDSSRTKEELTGVVRQENPDVAYVHNFFPLVSPSIYEVLSTLGVPCVQVAHDYRFVCPNALLYTNGAICEECSGGNFFSAVRHRCYRDSYVASIVAASVIASARRKSVFDLISTIVCPTPFSKRKLVKAGIAESKCVIKPHFIDSSAVVPRFQGEYVLYIGRLVPEKGVETLVRAMAKNPEIPLKIVGTGPLEKDLQEYIHTNHLEHIELVGFKSGAEKWKVLCNSAFVVIPSEWYETFGLTAIEAYAAGKCVIASRIGGLPYVVKDGQTGLLFQAGNADELRKQILQLWTQPREIERMGKFARQLAETKYSPDHNFVLLRQILCDAISRQRFQRRIA